MDNWVASVVGEIYDKIATEFLCASVKLPIMFMGLWANNGIYLKWVEYVGLGPLL